MRLFLAALSFVILLQKPAAAIEKPVLETAKNVKDSLEEVEQEIQAVIKSNKKKNPALSVVDERVQALKQLILKAIKKKNKRTFVPLCRVGYAIAEKDMKHQGDREDLEERELYYLRKFYLSDLPDKARYHFNAKMFDWSRLGLNGFAAAQTFGRDIYLLEAHRPVDQSTIYSYRQWKMLAHELMHVQQAETGDMASKYCEAYADADYDYYRNALEVEAFAAEDQFEPFYALQVRIEMYGPH